MFSKCNTLEFRMLKMERETINHRSVLIKSQLGRILPYCTMVHVTVHRYVRTRYTMYTLWYTTGTVRSKILAIFAQLRMNEMTLL